MDNCPLKNTNFFDIIEEGLHKVHLNQFAHRLIYCGPYFESWQSLLTMSVKESSSLLIVYSNYFIHVLEGSESDLVQHLEFVNIMNFKLISIFFNIERKYFQHCFLYVAEKSLEFDDSETSTLTFETILTELGNWFFNNSSLYPNNVDEEFLKCIPKSLNTSELRPLNDLLDFDTFKIIDKYEDTVEPTVEDFISKYVFEDNINFLPTLD